MTWEGHPPWLRPMRRKDREISDDERLWTILRHATVCRIALCSEGWPYIVPMNVGCLGDKLYFHCASSGTKLDLLRGNANVCFEVEANVRIVLGERACEGTTHYQSVIGWGRICVVESIDEKRVGLDALLSQAARCGGLPVQVLDEVPDDVVILRIDVDSLSGKQSLGREAL